MTDERRGWRRQCEAFWWAHHEARKRSDLNQRQYCEAEGIPLKAFGNWRSIFKAEPLPPERKLLYRRLGPSHILTGVGLAAAAGWFFIGIAHAEVKEEAGTETTLRSAWSSGRCLGLVRCRSSIPHGTESSPSQRSIILPF